MREPNAERWTASTESSKFSDGLRKFGDFTPPLHRKRSLRNFPCDTSGKVVSLEIKGQC
jgi:hypothetical protein